MLMANGRSVGSLEAGSEGIQQLVNLSRESSVGSAEE